MEWKTIQSFLLKATRFVNQDGDLRGSAARAIKDAVGVDVEAGALVLSGTTIYLKVHPVIKSEIFLKKDKILSRFKEEALTARITNIV